MSFAKRVYVRPPKSPLVPITNQRGVYARVGDEVAAVPKEVILRSRPYRMWVATHECFLCHVRDFSQAAHENGAGKAKGAKVCDSRVFPACGPHWGMPGCHWMFDNYVDISREEARELGAKLSAQMRERAIAAGWVFTATEIRKQ